jgi:uncharacterized protein YjlB
MDNNKSTYKGTAEGGQQGDRRELGTLTREERYAEFRSVERHIIPENGIFPNSRLPVLLFKDILALPTLFPSVHTRKLFQRNGWSNAWRDGIYTFNHYHSNTHEAMGVIKGATFVQLGGDGGARIYIEAGDVLIIPAGVSHKNMGVEDQVTCIGAYPEGRNYDMNYGKPGERPLADENIALVPIPDSDPVKGPGKGLSLWWW